MTWQQILPLAKWDIGEDDLGILLIWQVAPALS